MSDLSAAWTAESSRLADRVRRKVIVEHETPLYFAFLQIVHELLVFLRPQRRSDHRLGFTAGKQR